VRVDDISPYPHIQEKEAKLSRLEYTPDPLIAPLVNLEEEAATEYAQHVRSIFEQDNKLAVACQGLESTIASHTSTIQTLCETNYAV
jgi:tRNA A37 threonylcarbamoyladenosine synthetase subunit TsaC/SUA5/YrdC